MITSCGLVRRQTRVAVLCLIAFVSLINQQAMGLIESATGNQPVSDGHWPAGSVALANLKSRIGWWEGPPYGGGERCFLYRGNSASFQTAIDLFSHINAPKLELIIHDSGPADTPFLQSEKKSKTDTDYDWSFTVWNPDNWNRLFNDPTSQFQAQEPDGRFRETVAPPTLDLYTQSDGGIDFSTIKVPANITVTDERADASGFDDGSVVIGTVFDQSTAKPIAGAKITLATEKAETQFEEVSSCTSDSDGHFELHSARKGYFSILASADGYAPRVIKNAELRGHTLLRFVTSLSAAKTLKGIVLDSDSNPLIGVTLRAQSIVSIDGRGYVVSQPKQTTTDADGRFQFSGLPEGHSLVFADAPRYAQIDLLKPQAVPQDDAVIQMVLTGAISGRVVDKEGHLATGGHIDMEPDVKFADRIGKWGGSADISAAGTFSFDQIPPGKYILSATLHNPAPAFTNPDPNAQKVTIKSGETIHIDVTGK